MDHALRLDTLSIAFLVLLEALSPAERAVFLLHEVFDYRYGEIAEILEKSEVACRQLNRRARQHVLTNRPRFDATPESHRRLLEGFIQAADSGDLEDFLQMLAEDVILVPDGGGTRGAAVRVLHGREKVASFIHGARRVADQALHFEIVSLNGQDAILSRTATGHPFFAVFLHGTATQADRIYVIAGKKLAGLGDSA